MKETELRAEVDEFNRCNWFPMEFEIMTKYCRMTQGFVSEDFDCETCDLCANPEVGPV